MNKNVIIGSMTALITPFKEGKLDEQTYAKLIKRQIANGISAVVPVGTTGESATLTHDEHRVCIEIAVDACKGTDVKVLAGAGSNATHEAIGLAQFAQAHGADGILSVAPYYNDCENIYGVKEASGSIDKCVDLLAHEPRLSVLSGEDAINYPILSNGGKGVISVTANLLPDYTARLTKFALQNEFLKAKQINDDLYAINKILFCESNPIPIKAAMYIAGLTPSLEYRLPLCEPSAENLKKIENVMKQYAIKGF